jgi:hypothetical protein
MGKRYGREREGTTMTRDNYGENGRHSTTNNNERTNDVNTNDKEQDGTRPSPMSHCSQGGLQVAWR